jgi:uncharacterized OB-fold protein
MTSIFFEGARNGLLLIQCCERCGHYQFALAGRSAAVGRCRACTAQNPPWVATRGVATLVSYTVLHGRPHDDSVAPSKVAGIAELIEGPWVHGVIDAAASQLEVGMPLTVGITSVTNEKIPVPIFRSTLS